MSAMYDRNYISNWDITELRAIDRAAMPDIVE
jgi:hypothetical protein